MSSVYGGRTLKGMDKRKLFFLSLENKELYIKIIEKNISLILENLRLEHFWVVFFFFFFYQITVYGTKNQYIIKISI